MSKAKAQANTLTSHQVTKVFNRIRLMSNPHQKAAIMALSLSGRRSLASRLNASNVPLETIARTLGHSETQTTLVYIEISRKQLEKAAVLAL